MNADRGFKLNQKALVSCENFGGLGNRLKRLVSALLRHDIKNISTNDNTYNYIFENNFAVVKELQVNHSKYCGWRLDATEFLPQDFTSTVSLALIDNDLKDCNIRCSIDYEYNHIPANLKTLIASKFKLLRPKHQLIEIVDDFHRSYPNVVGMHIRTWKDASVIKNRLFSFESIVKEIKLISDINQILICSDDNSLVRQLESMFGNKIVTLESYFPLLEQKHMRFSNRHGIASMVAFTEMLALSRTKYLIGCHLSSFTECAWYISGCKIPINLI